MNSPRESGESIAAPVGRVEVLWRERRDMPGDTVATVTASVVPSSGVGWVDCIWEAKVSRARPFRVNPEERRLLADWRDQDHARVVRQVIPVADEWFAHCTQLAERELAVAALAAAAEPAMMHGPIGMTGPGPIIPTGQPRMQQLVEHLRKQMAELQKSSPVGVRGVLGGVDLRSLFPEGYFGDAEESRREGYHVIVRDSDGRVLDPSSPLPPPGVGGEFVQGPSDGPSQD